MGAIGVRIFFVLSGFLITAILLNGRGDEVRTAGRSRHFLRQFYVRRFLRIFPAYYFALAITAAVNIRPVRETILWHIAYLSNVYFAHRGTTYGPITHLWSLSVEEQFYLIWPWIILFTPKRWLCSAVIATIAIGPLFRLTMQLAGCNELAVMWLPFGCLDTLATGALLAIMSDASFGITHWKTPLLKVCGWIGAAIYILCAVAPSHFIPAVTLGDLGLAMFGFWLIGTAAIGFRGWFGKLLAAPTIVYVGTISYGLYIYHNFMAIVVPHMFARLLNLQSGGYSFFLLCTAAALVTASLSWFLFEKPINSFKRYFPYDKRRKRSIAEKLLAPNA